MFKNIFTSALVSTIIYSCSSEVDTVTMRLEDDNSIRNRSTSNIEFRQRNDRRQQRDEEDRGRGRGCCCLLADEGSSDEEEVEQAIDFATDNSNRIETKSNRPNDRYIPLAEGQNHGYYIQTGDEKTIFARFECANAKDPFAKERNYWHMQEPQFCRNGFIADIPAIRREQFGRDPYNHKRAIERGWNLMYIPTEINGEKVSMESFDKFLSEKQSLRNSLLLSRGQNGSSLRRNGTTSSRRSIFRQDDVEKIESEEEVPFDMFEDVTKYLEEQKGFLELESTKKRRNDVIKKLKDAKSEFSRLSELVNRQNENSGWTEHLKVSSLSRRERSGFKLEGDLRRSDIEGCLNLDIYPHWVLYRKNKNAVKDLLEGDRHPTLLEAMFILLENPRIADEPIKTSMWLDDNVAKTLAVSYDQGRSSFITKTINPSREPYSTIALRNISESDVESTNCGFSCFSKTPVFCCGHSCVRPKYLCQFCYCPPTCKWPCGVTTKCCECGIPNCCCVFPCCCLLPCAYCPAIPGVCIYPTSSTCCERFKCSLKGLCW